MKEENTSRKINLKGTVGNRLKARLTAKHKKVAPLVYMSINLTLSCQNTNKWHKVDLQRE